MGYKVSQHQIKPSSPYWDYCVATCLASKNLYNTAMFTNRQSFAYGHGVSSQPEMDKMFRDDLNYKALPSKVAQLVLKQVGDSWQSYFKALTAWKKDSTTFTGKPAKPDYIEPKGLNLVKWNKQAFSKTAFKKGLISPSMCPFSVPAKPGLEIKDIVEIRLVPKTGCFNLEVVFDDGQDAWKLTHKGLGAAIDLGLDNLAMITFSDPKVQPIAISGKTLKAINQWTNKENARLRSCLEVGQSTHKLNNLWRRRNNIIKDFLHRATRRIVDELDEIGVTCVAIGKTVGWKDNINIGRTKNQQFVTLPHRQFIDMLTRKLEAVGITVKVGEESYTSKASFLDWDNIPTYKPGNTEKYKFSGVRKKTKTYRSGSGRLINADVNGSFNIGRKVIPDYFGTALQEQVTRDSGSVVAFPRRLNIFKSLKMTNPKGMSRITYA